MERYKGRKRRLYFLLQRSYRSNNPPSTVAHRVSNISEQLAIFKSSHKFSTWLRAQKIEDYNHPLISKIKSTSSTATETYTSRDRCRSLYFIDDFSKNPLTILVCDGLMLQDGWLSGTSMVELFWLRHDAPKNTWELFTRVNSVRHWQSAHPT